MSNRTIARLMVIALGLAIGALLPAQAAEWGCLPTCSETDGRFLVISGAQNETFTGEVIHLRFAVPESEMSWRVGFFDGDSKGLWDSGTHVSGTFLYRLYADPDHDGSGTELVRAWTSDELTENSWLDFTLPVDSAAKSSADPFYYYHMVVEDTQVVAGTRESFKVRSSSYVGIAPDAFSYIDFAENLDEMRILYPQWPSLSPTTFDGTFDFYFFVPQGEIVDALDLWDGDMDHGSYDCSALDTDDPDTPSDLPSWATPETVAEGVAVGTAWPGYLCQTPTGRSTGTPSDDNGIAPFVRQPAVVYWLVGPDGSAFANPNPSGNREWERFRLTTDASLPADYQVDRVPSGFYRVHSAGVDIFNLNAWVLPYEAACVREDGEPCFPYDPEACTRTQGYWRQPKKPWPVPTLSLGGVVYSRSEVQAIIKKPGKGDKTYDLFAQLAAAKLNAFSGNYIACIAEEIAEADAWLVDHPLGSGVAGSSEAWFEISEVHRLLDDFNNGYLCAMHCD